MNWQNTQVHEMSHTIVTEHDGKEERKGNNCKWRYVHSITWVTVCVTYHTSVDRDIERGLLGWEEWRKDE